jgi:predicted nucleotidyltransferase component of viral defense system
MIDRAEVLERASELSLRPQIVEKDYVLGWLLAGIYQNRELADAWTFKGGTCLKKCFFETYRFSEDLDFTVSGSASLDGAALVREFQGIAAWVYDQAGIEIPQDQLRCETYTNPRGGTSCEGRVYYRGPIAPQHSLPRIKIDLTADEILVLEPQWRTVDHPYSDRPSNGIRARCYRFEEIFAEKTRALGERTRPRDLYDVVNLYHREETGAMAGPVLEVLRKKCAFKGLPVPDAESVESARAELTAEWSSMLAHQLPVLPPVHVFLAEVSAFFTWLGGGSVPAPRVALQTAGETPVRSSDLTAQGIIGSAANPLMRIRFAAANRLCVDLDYRDEQGRRAVRRIEPYSLRWTKDGAVVLHAHRADNGQHRSYRLDRIVGAAVTDQSFVPRWIIELSPAR